MHLSIQSCHQYYEALACITKQRGYVGIGFTEFHCTALRSHLVDVLLECFGKDGHPFFHANYKQQIDEEASGKKRQRDEDKEKEKETDKEKEKEKEKQKQKKTTKKKADAKKKAAKKKSTSSSSTTSASASASRSSNSGKSM